MALALATLLAACGGDTLQTRTGLVVAIESRGLGQVDGFTLRTSDGQEIAFDTTDTRFDPTGFPPDHLQEHRALAEPIRVTYQAKDGRNAVIKLEDGS